MKLNLILKMMNKKLNKIREQISGYEVLLRLITTVLVIVLVYYSEKSEREILNVVGFAIAFLTSIYLHKHFFPMMTATTLFYLLASSQQLYSGENEPPIIDIYWSIGNVLLVVSILSHCLGGKTSKDTLTLLLSSILLIFIFLSPIL